MDQTLPPKILHRTSIKNSTLKMNGSIYAFSFYRFQLVAADWVYISCNSVIDIHVFCPSKDDLRIKPDLRHSHIVRMRVICSVV